MRRSLAQSWREQRRARSGDVAWEESLWKKKWNYAERIQYTGGGWKGEGAFGIRRSKRRQQSRGKDLPAPFVWGVSSVGRGASSRRDRMPYQKPFDGGRTLIFQARKRRLSSFCISKCLLNDDELLQSQRGVGIRGKSFRCILKIFLAELHVAAGGFEARLHEKIARRCRQGFQLGASFSGFVCLTMQSRDADAFTQNRGAGHAAIRFQHSRMRFFQKNGQFF